LFSPDIQSRLDEIAALWNTVEGHLKKAERVRLEIVVGAINELRYAGRLAVDAFAIAGNSKLAEIEKLERIDRIIVEIKNNCIRAHADITDALVLFMHKHLAANVEDFSLSVVMTHFPQYGEMIVEIERINLFMAESREDRLRRQDIYLAINEHHLPKMVRLYDAMVATAPALLEEINKRAAREQRTYFYGKWGYVVGIVGAFIGGYLALAAGYHWWPLP